MLYTSERIAGWIHVAALSRTDIAIRRVNAAIRYPHRAVGWTAAVAEGDEPRHAAAGRRLRSFCSVERNGNAIECAVRLDTELVKRKPLRRADQVFAFAYPTA